MPLKRHPSIIPTKPLHFRNAPVNPRIHPSFRRKPESRQEGAGEGAKTLTTTLMQHLRDSFMGVKSGTMKNSGDSRANWNMLMLLFGVAQSATIFKQPTDIRLPDKRFAVISQF